MSSNSDILLSGDQVILVTALIKISFMAALAAVLSRYDTFKRMFFQEREGIRGRLYFAVLMGFIFSFSVAARILLGYSAIDLGREGTFLAGLIAGPLVGISVGVLVGLPPLGIGEYAALPTALLYGLVGGLLHGVCFKRRPRIFFSPLTLLLGRGFRREWFRKPDLKRDLLLFLGIVALELGVISVSRSLGSDLLFSLQPSHGGTLLALLIGTALAIAVPLMVWDHTYIELALIERDRGLMQARLDALKSKIQPHFLFNTLNTISATIRINPEGARSMVVKLAQILRTILDSTDDFRSLEKELSLIDDFLDIERARFGEDRIKVQKNIDAKLLGVEVPTLLIQPIVENSIIHGLRKKKGGETISIEARQAQGKITLVVEDDGAGISAQRLKVVKGVGIGLSNVEERLRVLYGSNYAFDMESEPGKGTKTTITFPYESPNLPKVAHA